MRKTNAKKGFTLSELLIVVAIIGVLVAISIPIFSAQLEKSREATDVANLRDCKAAAVAMFLDDTVEAEGTYTYDAERGTLVKWTNATTNGEAATAITGYGKGTAKLGHKSSESGANLFCLKTGSDAVIGNVENVDYYKNNQAVEDKVIKVVITNEADSEDSISMSWIAKGAVTP